MKQRYFTEDQKKQIYAYIDRHREDPCALMLDFLAVTGCRVEELMMLEWCDLDEKNLTATIHIGAKGSDSRTRKIPAQLMDDLLKFKKTLKQEARNKVTDIIARRDRYKVAKKKVLQRYFAELREYLFKDQRVPGLHGFRHSKAEQVYRDAKGDIYSVKLALGHKSISSTERYLTFVSEEKLQHVFSKRA